MTKSKKRIAIICVVLNILLLTQICFGSVSAFYDVLIGSEVEDQHICGECDHAELQAESVCTEEQLQNMRCPHNHTIFCGEGICEKQSNGRCSAYPIHGQMCSGGVKYYKCGYY